MGSGYPGRSLKQNVSNPMIDKGMLARIKDDSSKALIIKGYKRS